MTRAMRQLGAVTGVLGAVVVGGYLWGAVVAPGFWSAVALLAGWFLVIGTVTTRLSRRRPELKLALRGTYLAAAVAALAFGYLTSVRDTVVDEPLVTGAPASQPAQPGDPGPSVEDLLGPQE